MSVYFYDNKVIQFGILACISHCWCYSNMPVARECHVEAHEKLESCLSVTMMVVVAVA